MTTLAQLHDCHSCNDERSVVQKKNRIWRLEGESVWGCGFCFSCVQEEAKFTRFMIEFQRQWKQQLGRLHLEDSVLEAFQTSKMRVAKVSQLP